jgi:hypothetical protein
MRGRGRNIPIRADMGPRDTEEMKDNLIEREWKGVWNKKTELIEEVGERKEGTGCGQGSFLKRTCAGLAARSGRTLLLWWRLHTFFQGVAEGIP